MLRSMAIIMAATVVQVVFNSPAFAEEKKKSVKPTQTWKGSVADDQLGTSGPKVITTKKEFETIWKEWKIDGDVPTVDFEKEFVALVYSRGSVLNLNASQEGDNLILFPFGTKDLRPGTRFVMGTFTRDGIKKVNGTDLK